jgi:hypothetical protein
MTDMSLKQQIYQYAIVHGKTQHRGPWVQIKMYWKGSVLFAHAIQPNNSLIYVKINVLGQILVYRLFKNILIPHASNAYGEPIEFDWDQDIYEIECLQYPFETSMEFFPK